MGLLEAAIAAYIGASAAATVVAVAINVAISAVIAVVIQAFSSPPEAPELDRFGFGGGRTLNTRQAISQWEIVYGEVRKGGVITYEESTGDNRYYHRVVTLASHSIDSVLAYYLNDDVVYPDQLDSNGLVLVGPYKNQVRIQIDLGTTGAQPFPDLVAASAGKWTDAHRQEGHAKVYVRYDFDAKVFATGVPAITVRGRWKKYTDSRTAALTFGTNPSQIIHDYMQIATVDGGMGVSAARINTTVLNASANVDEELVAVATGQSHAATSVDATNDTVDMAGELCKFITGDVGQWTTTGTLPAGLALVTDYYIAVIRERSSSTASIRVKLATTLANLRAGTFVDITGAGSGTHTLNKTKEPRYSASGIISTDREPQAILSDLKSAFGGRILYVGGKWLIKSGAYETPTITFDEDDLVGAITVQTKISRATRFNAVKGLFVSPLQFDQPAEYPLVSDATYQAADGGTQLVQDINLPFTPRHAGAQRLATLEIQRHRREATVEMPVNMRGFLVTGGDVVMVTNSVLGFASQPFEVASWKFENSGDGDAPSYRIVLGLRQTDSAVYTYSTTGEITQPPRVLSSLANPFLVQPVTGLALTSGTAALFTKADGTVVSRLRVAWAASADGQLSGNRVEFKKSADSAYALHAVIPVGQTEAFIFEVEDGVSYDARVTALGYFGGEAVAVIASDHMIIGKSAAPGTPSTFTITIDADGTRSYQWTLISDADVSAGGGYEIKYYLGATADYSAMTPLHDGILVASPYESNLLAAGTYTFAIKAVDSTGNVSATAQFITSVAITDPRIANALVARNEGALGWPGTLVDCFVDSDAALRATGTLAWSGLAATSWESMSTNWTGLPSTWNGFAGTWDDLSSGGIPSWASFVNPNSPITYTSPEIDITGTSFDVTFTPLVTLATTGTQTITMETGTNAQGGTAGGFVPFATVTGRYVKIRISISGSVPDVSQMTVIIDSPAKVEDFDDIDTSGSTAGLFETIGTGHFLIGTKGGISLITQAQITALQNVGPGYTWELISKANSLTAGGVLAAEFKVYDETDTLADATVDALLRGVKAN